MTIRIVVADDHAPFRSCLKALLDQQPGLFVARTIDGGQQAVEALSAARGAGLPDVLVLDLDMRDLSGLDAARRILAHHPRLPILILSWHDDLPFVTAACQAGCQGYMLKDDPLPELVLAIRELAAGRSHVSSTLRDVQTSGQPMSAFC
jgi:DNA-binding NarL/FixJ family response regulator